MNFDNIKKNDKIRIRTLFELGNTAVNIAVNLSKLCKLKVRLNIISMDMVLDLSKAEDVLKLCTRLLIDQEFQPEKDTAFKKTNRKKSMLDKYTPLILLHVNNGVKTTAIINELGVSRNAYWNWRKTRTTIINGKVVLK